MDISDEAVELTKENAARWVTPVCGHVLPTPVLVSY